MEGFQAWDRHNPLPHITPSPIALKSPYENTTFLSTRTSAELRKLLIPGRPGMRVPRGCSLRLWTWRDCVKCVIAQRQLHSRWADHRIARTAAAKRLRADDLLRASVSWLR
jgi:hypothetical protein